MAKMAMPLGAMRPVGGGMGVASPPKRKEQADGPPPILRPEKLARVILAPPHTHLASCR